MKQSLSEFNQNLSEDSELIRSLNEGEQVAFTRLYDKYVGRVYGFLMKMLDNAEIAEDLTQFCFMQIWINRKNISAEKSLPAYLFVIAKNAAYKEFRKHLIAESYIEASYHPEEAVPADYGNVDFKLIQQEVSRIISQLPESRKKIYIMSRVEGMRTAEIAEKLKISPKTVDAQISRVKLALRKGISRIMILSAIALLSNENLPLTTISSKGLSTVQKEEL